MLLARSLWDEFDEGHLHHPPAVGDGADPDRRCLREVAAVGDLPLGPPVPEPVTGVQWRQIGYPTHVGQFAELTSVHGVLTVWQCGTAPR